MNNLEIKEGWCIIKLNPDIYPLDIIYSASYVFLDRAFIVLDGDPYKEILVKIQAKKENTEELSKEFFNELINYGDYKNNAEKTKNIREMIIQRSLLTNDNQDVDYDNIINDIEMKED
ncbi:MAG: hypothetical protein ACQER9_03050 [Nanobdellota archaeon]